MLSTAVWNLKEADKAWTECTLFQHNTLSHPNWRTFWHTLFLSNASGTIGITTTPSSCSQVAPPTVTHITVLTVSGITKWHCQQCGVRQGVCMYPATSYLLHMLSGSANDPVLVTLLTVPGTITFTLVYTLYGATGSRQGDVCAWQRAICTNHLQSICNTMRAQVCL